MDNQTAPAAKQTKGIKKLWLRVKASMKNESSSSRKANTTTATQKSTTAPIQAQSKPITEPTPAPVAEAIVAPSEPVTTSKPEYKVEDVKPLSNPIMATDIIEVDDEDDEDDKLPQPQIKHVGAPSSDKEAIAHRYQRAQDVFKKYDMTLDLSEWQQQNNSTVERVEKQPRMRVRYACHECKSTFGRDKKCSNCNHVRCNACVRYPPKKTGDKAKKGKKIEATPSTLEAPTTGACHECKTNFKLGANECENCNHEICSRCLRETVLASPATAPPTAQPVAVAAAS